MLMVTGIDSSFGLEIIPHTQEESTESIRTVVPNYRATGKSRNTTLSKSVCESLIKLPETTSRWMSRGRISNMPMFIKSVDVTQRQC